MSISDTGINDAMRRLQAGLEAIAKALEELAKVLTSK